MEPTFLSHTEKDDLVAKNSGLFIDDNIELALNELFDIEYPAQKDTKTEKDLIDYRDRKIGQNDEAWGSWVYYPWLHRVVHVPPVADFRALRTSRNRNLITKDEQIKLYGSTILVIGMSVGSNIVEALVSQGIGGKLILVDMDVIEPSNLNRIRSPYYHIGLHKVEAIARKAWEVDPYLKIVKYTTGFNEQNMGDILNNKEIDVVVDEMDDLRMKILLREEAIKRNLPILMAADDGDDSLIEIERYDLHKNNKPFGGRIPETILDQIKKGNIPRAKLGMMIGKYFVGADYIPLRMYKSLAEVGKTLPSWPQLGGAAALSGIVIAYCTRKILLSESIKEGRILVSLDEKIDLERQKPAHKEELNKFKSYLLSLE